MESKIIEVQSLLIEAKDNVELLINRGSKELDGLCKREILLLLDQIERKLLNIG